MKRLATVGPLVILACLVQAVLVACEPSSTDLERKAVQRQQGQYSIGQPVPAFDWSLERDLLIKLYGLRNEKVSTHSVWRSNYGMIEGDCPSIGYGLPYDTSLTNPLQSVGDSYHAVSSVGQAEPNGIFASVNTAATWVTCVSPTGLIEPVYVESKVTVYPYAVAVDYDSDRVSRSGEKSITLDLGGS